MNEVALPAGTLSEPTLCDINFVEAILGEIETRGLAAPAPIEQRWTSASTSPMSVVSDPAGKTTLFSWVGIIMYLCIDDDAARDAITKAFAQYRGVIETELDHKFDAYQHWAKIEVPQDPDQAHRLRARLRARFPVALFNDLRALLDPKGVLSNDFIDHLFGQ